VNSETLRNLKDLDWGRATFGQAKIRRQYPIRSLLIGRLFSSLESRRRDYVLIHSDAPII
jgi:hypothetical protein